MTRLEFEWKQCGSLKVHYNMSSVPFCHTANKIDTNHWSYSCSQIH